MLENEGRKPMSLAERIIQIARSKRKYASFFCYPKRDIAEWGVVKTFLQAIGQDDDVQEIRKPLQDPPDVIVVDEAGNKLGYEVTELVDRGTVEQAAKGLLAVKTWDSDEVLRKAEAIIAKKDLKSFHGGPYKTRVLIIFTDEPDLAPVFHMRPLREHTFPATRNFDEVHFLFSFDPTTEDYPVVRLRLSGMP